MLIKAVKLKNKNIICMVFLLKKIDALTCIPGKNRKVKHPVKSEQISVITIQKAANFYI